MATFRKTWRHEVSIIADTEDEANDIWENLNLGKLDKAEKKEVIVSHSFVEDVSMDEQE